jgi:hypothetical protein
MALLDVLVWQDITDTPVCVQANVLVLHLSHTQTYTHFNQIIVSMELFYFHFYLSIIHSAYIVSRLMPVLTRYPITICCAGKLF